MARSSLPAARPSPGRAFARALECLWDPASSTERDIARLEVDAPILCLVVVLRPDGHVAAGDGSLYWLNIVE
jgi:hypothetical protein